MKELHLGVFTEEAFKMLDDALFGSSVLNACSLKMHPDRETVYELSDGEDAVKVKQQIIRRLEWYWRDLKLCRGLEADEKALRLKKVDCLAKHLRGEEQTDKASLLP